MMYPDNYNAYEAQGAQMTGLHGILSGDDDAELMGGPLRNILKKVVARVREKRAGKNVGFNLSPENAISANVTDVQQQQYQQPTSSTTGKIPGWAIPAGIGAAALITILAIRK